MPELLHGWQRSDSVAEWLFEEPQKFEFYQAVRLLEAFRPIPLVFFRSAVKFQFPASEIQDLDRGPGVARLTVNFFGLAGALGPLPQAYTEMLLDAAARKDRGGTDFLDIFNHRLISLLYRVRQAHRPALTSQAPDQTLSAELLFATIGFAFGRTRKALGIPARSLLQYSGILSRRIRTAAGLAIMLTDYLGIPVRVDQFRGVWRNIDQSQWTTIGFDGRNNALGTECTLGKRAWDQAGAIRLTLGPLDLKGFTQFLPGSDRRTSLYRLVLLYLEVGQSARVRLLLRGSEVPQSRIGKARLGLTSWLITRPGTAEDRHVNFSLASDAI